ncbi:MAG: diadenylate cyclase [Flavobacteriales bacterium]|nr:diadenylate cyclase [Flavobacteriales bacterium]MBP6696535.1 diadenylate cyclase [Flavobacteriales bacterium]
MNAKNWLVGVVEGLKGNPPVDFAGMGLIVCKPGLPLPLTSLVPRNALPVLPNSGLEETVEFLRRVTSKRSPYHDGFHLIDGQEARVVGVSYFMAPPLPEATGIDQFERPIGARHMAALLGSRIEGVTLVLTMDPSMTVSVFIQGALVDFDEWVKTKDSTHAH